MSPDERRMRMVCTAPTILALHEEPALSLSGPAFIASSSDFWAAPASCVLPIQIETIL
jgi:hypothetical protein